LIARMTRWTPFRSGVLVSGLVALGWAMVPGCGGGSSKSDGGAGAGGHAGATAGAGGHAGATAGAGGHGAGGESAAGADGGLAGAGGSADAGAAGAGGNDGGPGGGSAGSTGQAGAGGHGGAAGGSAGSTGKAGAGGHGGAGGGSAGAGGHCATSFGAANKVLYDFSDGTVDGWANNGQGQAIAWSGSTGHTCPGALQLVLPGTSGAGAVLYAFLPSANWTGSSKLHVWAKIQTTNYAVGSSLLLYVQANNYTVQASDYHDLAGSAFTDGAFHELVLDLTSLASANALTDVDVIALGVNQPTTDAGSLAPVTVSIDDLWLEPAPERDAAAGN
jgi:hypothetical protein